MRFDAGRAGRCRASPRRRPAKSQLSAGDLDLDDTGRVTGLPAEGVAEAAIATRATGRATKVGGIGITQTGSNAAACGAACTLL
jgi:hypothetical protein